MVAERQEPPAGTLALISDTWNAGQLDLIRRTVAAECSNEELALFALVCRRTGLDPFARQIYAIKRSGKMTIQTGIDGYRLLAARTGTLAGIDDPIYDSEDAEHPGKASVTVYRLIAGQRVPFTASARWSEYVQERSPMWGKMPYLMLGKCAEALALRKAFPAELSGVYTGEEMAQADGNEPAYAVESAAPAERQQANPAAALTMAGLRKLALDALGMTQMADYEALVKEATSKTLAQVMKDRSQDDKVLISQVIHERLRALQAKQAAHVTTEADLTTIPAVVP